MRARVFCTVRHRSAGDALQASGVGVAFHSLDDATAAALRAAVEERAARYLP